MGICGQSERTGPTLTLTNHKRVGQVHVLDHLNRELASADVGVTSLPQQRSPHTLPSFDTHTYIRTHIYTHTHIYAHTLIYIPPTGRVTNVRVIYSLPDSPSPPTNTHTRIHTYTHTHTHTHTHTRMHMYHSGLDESVSEVYISSRPHITHTTYAS